MASRMIHRSFSVKSSLSSFFYRSIASVSEYPIRNKFRISASSSFRLRPLVAACQFNLQPSTGFRCFSVRPATSSLNDSSPNWSNRPPKETILLDGCDFEHWLVVLEKPEGDPTRDEIIDSYIKTLAMVVGSEEEARMKIYSVSTRCYYGFGALVSEELSYKIKELPRVQWVLPDSYLDVKNKDYGGEPFINGQAVPYDPKYHAEWIRNHEESLRRNKRNSNRPRNFDRSRNFERRRENMQYQTQAPPVTSPMPNIPAGQQPNSAGLGGQPNNPVGPPPGNFGPNTPPSNFSPNTPPSNFGHNTPPTNFSPNTPPSNFSQNAQPNTFNPNVQPNTFRPNTPPSNFSPNTPPSNFSPNAQPNTFSPNAPPCNFSPNTPPSNFSSNAQPNTFSPNAQPNTFSPNSQPNTFSPNPQPSNFSPNPQPSSFSPNPQLNTFNPSSQPNTSNLNSQPSNFAAARPNTGSFQHANSGGIMPSTWSNNANVGPPNFSGSAPPNPARPMAGNVPGSFPPTNINGPPSNAMAGYPNVTGGAPISTGRLPQSSVGGPQHNNFGGIPPMQGDTRWPTNSAPQSGATPENLQSRD